MTTEGKISIWQRLIEFKIKNSIMILALIVAGTGFFSYKIATGLRVYTDFFQLYPPKHEYIKLYNEYHALIVMLGKEYCKKSRPRCEECPLHVVQPISL